MMRFITHEEDQGQFVEISYLEKPLSGWGYRRITDRGLPVTDPARVTYQRVWVAGRLWNEGPTSDWISHNWKNCEKPRGEGKTP